MADEQRRRRPIDQELLTKLEEALFEIRRVIAGQEAMLERVLVCLLAGGHLLIEGVPGLAKTLTIKSTASVLGGTFKRDPVHAGPRPERPRRHAGLPARPARVRHRARPGLLQLPARRRDQPRAGEGAVGAARGDAGAPGHDRPHDASRCPIRSSCSRRRTRSSPKAPIRCPRRRSTASCSRCSSTTRPTTRSSPSSRARSSRRRRSSRCSRSTTSGRSRRRSAKVYVDPALISWVVDLATATRKPAEHGLDVDRPRTSPTAPARAGRSA